MTNDPSPLEAGQQELALLRRRVAQLEKAEAERSQVEQALRQQAAILQEQAELLDLAHDTIMVRDPDNRILFWNRGAEETYGWSREEALGKVTHTFLRTTFPKPLQEIEEDLLREGRWEGELAHTKKDGATIVVASRWALRRGPEGHPVAILEINNDITQRKHAEDALRRTLEELDERVQERTAELVGANQALRAREQELNEVNSALQVLLKQQERYRADMEDQILTNVRMLILPYLENLLTTRLSPDQKAQAEIMESNLRNLVSQFTRRLSAANLGLTPKELQIANLVRDGKTTKEIAELLHLSSRGVVFHRQNLREKLGLKTSKNKNLRAELLSLA